MIFVDGVPLSAPSSSSQGSSTLDALMEHPTLVSAATSFEEIPERVVSEELSLQMSTQSRCVYVFQREYATVDPRLVDLVGTDEATTCVGLVIRNRQSRMVSIAHMDSPKVVDGGLVQMLSRVVNRNSDAILDVHLIGAFEDASTEPVSHSSATASLSEMGGYSFPLCTKIVETLQESREKFHIQTFFVLRHNTRRDSKGNAYPIFNGIMMETSSGLVFPASFDRTARCPDEIVRRIRVTASCEDPRWNGKLLETYDTRTDRYIIAPCYWTSRKVHIAKMLRHRSDAEILLTCSTSPSAEGPDFVKNERRNWDYLIQHPDWKETFPRNQSRVFKRTASGWERCAE